MRLKLLMYFSRSRSFANSSFRREAGTSTFLWRARTALRTHVRKSATGSETDSYCLPFPRARLVSHAIRRPFPAGTYQLDLTTPGIWPDSASSRKQMRHSPKWRR